MWHNFPVFSEQKNERITYFSRWTVHLVDIWNVIEAFRENGLNTLEAQSEVSVARLETLVSSLYHNLNKRLTTAQQVPVDSKASLLLNWLIAAYSSDNSGKMRVFSIKVALATMCAGKLVDKLRCKCHSWIIIAIIRPIFQCFARVFRHFFTNIGRHRSIGSRQTEWFPTGNIGIAGSCIRIANVQLQRPFGIGNIFDRRQSQCERFH